MERCRHTITIRGKLKIRTVKRHDCKGMRFFEEIDRWVVLEDLNC